MELAEQTFIVTGGASGLGAATARRFADRGARVVIADLDRCRGEEVAASLGKNAAFIECDITSADSVQAVVDLAVDRPAPLRGVVHCAGIVHVEKLLNRELHPAGLDAFAKTVEINLIGTFNVVRLVAAALARQSPDAQGERGVVIQTASVAAFDGQIGQAAYAAAKAGVAGMTLPLTRELGRHGVRVVTIAPGVCGTPMMSGIPDAAREQLEASVPFPKRMGRPEEFAALAEQIIANVYLNGEVIRLDGGIRMA